MYQKNTKISIKIRGDGSELFEYELPFPHRYNRTGEVYNAEWLINGFFGTAKGIAYLNDIIARFCLSMEVISTKVTSSESGNIELSQFQGLKSIVRHKDYERGLSSKDNIFWAIKYYTEDLIKEYGEGKIVPYSLIESFAFARFIDRAKDKSTLKAKCRSIWNWYDERGWITTRRFRMSRQEAGINAARINAAKTKAKVQKAIAGLEFMQEKINIANVARDARVSRDTAKKYLFELGYTKGGSTGWKKVS